MQRFIAIRVLHSLLGPQVMNRLLDLQEQHEVSYLLIAHHLATTRCMADEVVVM